LAATAWASNAAGLGHFEHHAIVINAGLASPCDGGTLADRAIPPTNNGSEQALRPCVTFRKVTNCFRSQWGANLYADVRSVIETALRRAIGALEAIRLTLNGTPLPVPSRPAPIRVSNYTKRASA
jgi:hypothetical protein